MHLVRVSGNWWSEQLPVQGIIGILGGCRDQNDLIRMLMADPHGSQRASSYCVLFRHFQHRSKSVLPYLFVKAFNGGGEKRRGALKAVIRSGDALRFYRKA